MSAIYILTCFTFLTLCIWYKRFIRVMNLTYGKKLFLCVFVLAYSGVQSWFQTGNIRETSVDQDFPFSTKLALIYQHHSTINLLIRKKADFCVTKVF